MKVCLHLANRQLVEVDGVNPSVIQSLIHGRSDEVAPFLRLPGRIRPTFVAVDHIAMIEVLDEQG